MRFDLPDSIAAMRAGTKTQTRRRDASGFWLRKRHGSRITVKHKGEHLGWAVVKATWRERLGELTSISAEAEGYPALMAFLDAWKRMYPEAELSDNLTVLEFGPVHWRNDAS